MVEIGSIMEYKTLELNILSAKDLRNVNLFSKMDVYVVVSLISGGSYPMQRAKTTVHRGGGTSPRWYFPLKFTVDESEARQNLLTIEIKLLSKHKLRRDKNIGVVNLSVKELLELPRDGNVCKFVTYLVEESSPGMSQGKGSLNISYNFVDKIVPSVLTPPPPPLQVVPSPAENKIQQMRKKKSIYALLTGVLVGDVMYNSAPVRAPANSRSDDYGGGELNSRHASAVIRN